MLLPSEIGNIQPVEISIFRGDNEQAEKLIKDLVTGFGQQVSLLINFFPSFDEKAVAKSPKLQAEMKNPKKATKADRIIVLGDDENTLQTARARILHYLESIGINGTEKTFPEALQIDFTEKGARPLATIEQIRKLISDGVIRLPATSFKDIAKYNYPEGILSQELPVSIPFSMIKNGDLKASITAKGELVRYWLEQGIDPRLIMLQNGKSKHAITEIVAHIMRQNSVFEVKETVTPI